MKVTGAETQYVLGLLGPVAPQHAHTPERYPQDSIIMEAVPVPATSGALREPHLVLTMSIMDLGLFCFLVFYGGVALIIQSVNMAPCSCSGGVGEDHGLGRFC